MKVLMSVVCVHSSFGVASSCVFTTSQPWGCSPAFRIGIEMGTPSSFPLRVTEAPASRHQGWAGRCGEEERGTTCGRPRPADSQQRGPGRGSPGGPEAGGGRGNQLGERSDLGAGGGVVSGGGESRPPARAARRPRKRERRPPIRGESRAAGEAGWAGGCPGPRPPP